MTTRFIEPQLQRLLSRRTDIVEIELIVIRVTEYIFPFSLFPVTPNLGTLASNADNGRRFDRSQWANQFP